MEVIPNLCGLFVPGEGLHISESGESAVSLPLEWSAHLHSLAANLFEKSGGSITRLKSMTWTMFKCLEYLWTYFLARLSGLRPILLDAPVSPKLESKDKRGQMAPGSLHRFVNRQPEPLRAMVQAVCGLFIGEDEVRRMGCKVGNGQQDSGAVFLFAESNCSNLFYLASEGVLSSPFPEGQRCEICNPRTAVFPEWNPAYSATTGQCLGMEHNTAG